MARKGKPCRAGGPPAAGERGQPGRSPYKYPVPPELILSPLGRKSPSGIGTSPLDGLVLEDSSGVSFQLAHSDNQATKMVALPVFRDDAHGIWLYHGNCLSILDAIYAKHGDAGCFDMIFADPPYFLSNGGITCHAGRMVKVDKGEWDKSRGPELNHEFNTEWLKRCQRVLKPNGTIWVTGTHHVIFSVGYAMQQLGMKILNDIAWEKPNPPPNLSCRYFTHSTETVIWAARNEKSKHVFNYKLMKAVTGKQMKTVWQFYSPRKDEKIFGKHPTQKPVALIERCLLAATHAGDFVLDPFMGAGTTAVACVRAFRLFVGIELDYRHVELAGKRANREIIEIWLRDFRVRVEVSVICHPELVESRVRRDAAAVCGKSLSFRPGCPTKNDQNDLDPGNGSMDRISEMADVPEIQAERIFHETKFVFLSCAQVRAGSVVHTTVDADVQSAWSHTPRSVKLQTTHIVRCETEILRVKNG